MEWVVQSERNVLPESKGVSFATCSKCATHSLHITVYTSFPLKAHSLTLIDVHVSTFGESSSGLKMSRDINFEWRWLCMIDYFDIARFLVMLHRLFSSSSCHVLQFISFFYSSGASMTCSNCSVRMLVLSRSDFVILWYFFWADWRPYVCREEDCEKAFKHREARALHEKSHRYFREGACLVTLLVVVVS